jgi:hypothetical protein
MSEMLPQTSRYMLRLAILFFFCSTTAQISAKIFFRLSERISCNWTMYHFCNDKSLRNGYKIQIPIFKCGLSSMVSRRKHVGLIVNTETMFYSACDALVDVSTKIRSTDGQLSDEDQFSIGKCLLCSGTEPVAWIEGKPCPRCGAKMIKDEDDGLIAMGKS